MRVAVLLTQAREATRGYFNLPLGNLPSHHIWRVHGAHQLLCGGGFSDQRRTMRHGEAHRKTERDKKTKIKITKITSRASSLRHFVACFVSRLHLRGRRACDVVEATRGGGRQHQHPSLVTCHCSADDDSSRTEEHARQARLLEIAIVGRRSEMMIKKYGCEDGWSSILP